MTIQDALIDTLPAGIDRALMRILSFHQGKDNAIGRFELECNLASHGFVISDRETRAAINALRKAGNPICSCGGEGGGYYLASDWHELDDYISHELHPRAMDLLEQEAAMRKSYPPDLQMRFG